MGFLALLQVASMPIVQVLLLTLVGAFMASDYCKLLSSDTRKSLNKIVFNVFTPSLIFASLAQTVTLQDIISWWFMPVNIGITFLFGTILGWLVVRILRPKPHLEGLIIATCSSGNLGNLMLIIVPAICDEDGGPFGNREACRVAGLSYASFSMALGSLYIWTWSYQLVRGSAVKFRAMEAAEEASKEPNKDFDAGVRTNLLNGGDEEPVALSVPPAKLVDEDLEDQATSLESSTGKEEKKAAFWIKIEGFLHQIFEELTSPPTLAAIVGFVFGAIKWLKNLIIGEGAPLRVIHDSVKLLGNGTIPCITLILGGNLIQGLRSSAIRPLVIIGVLCVRYVALPVIGIWVVKAAGSLGYLPSDPLYHYVLMIQFCLPPAMNIGTMTQLFDVGQEECSVLLLWSYAVAALSLTAWSTLFMWILQ